jgi:hypothetical protein
VSLDRCSTRADPTNELLLAAMPSTGIMRPCDRPIPTIPTRLPWGPRDRHAFESAALAVQWLMLVELSERDRGCRLGLAHSKAWNRASACMSEGMTRHHWPVGSTSGTTFGSI